MNFKVMFSRTSHAGKNGRYIEDWRAKRRREKKKGEGEERDSCERERGKEKEWRRLI